VLDLVADDGAIWGRWFPAFQGPARDGDDLIQVAFERCLRGWPLLLTGFQKQLRLGEDALACLLGFGIAPGVVKECGLAGGPVLLREDSRHAVTVFHAEARHWRQVPHSDLCGNASFANLLLDGLGQCVYQGQTASDPGCTAVEAARQVFDGVAMLVFHLGQQPALLQCGLRLAAAAQGMHQQQGFGFAHRVQNQRFHRVTPQLLQRGDALVSIDHQIALRAGDHQDRHLLAHFSERGQ
jgi:hypothetical protein